VFKIKIPQDTILILTPEGTNENTNGLIREYLPKGMNLALISQSYLNAIARQLNNRPRRCLDDETPFEVFSHETSNSAGGVAFRT
jgi:IS30 family transposase